MLVGLAMALAGASAQEGPAQAPQTVPAPTPPKPPAAFTPCAACHATAAGRVSPVGPNLFGVVGRVSGTVRSSLSSPAMKKAAIVWDEKKLDAYLAAPLTLVPGTAMPNTPVKDPAIRREIIAYLLSLK
jgi:cytochrome c